MTFDPAAGARFSIYILIALMLIGLGLRVVAARSETLAHPDEVFQTQEPAHHLAYGYGVVTWEWREGIRSWVFPAFLAAVMRATGWMGAGSSGYLLGIVLVLSMISLTTVWFAFAWAKRSGGIAAAIIAAGSAATWYQLIDFGGRALTEVLATHLLLPGLYLGVYGEKIPERRRMFLAGIFCGLALSLRIQLTPAVAFALLWFCHGRWRTRIAPLGAGFVLPLALFGAIDMLTWSYPFQSFVRYFWENAIEGRSKGYGVSPLGSYVWTLFLAFGPMLVFVLAGCRRSPFLGWMALIILASHSVLAHKEVRFLYPLIPLMVTLAALGVEEIMSNIRIRDRPFPSQFTIAGGLIVCVVASFLLASQFPIRPRYSGGTAAFDWLSHDSDLCSVGVYSVPWFDTGGYTHLHRKVPILLFSDASEVAANAASFNALLAPSGASGLADGLRRVTCWNGVCLYTRSGVCAAPPPGTELNASLRQSGN